MALTIDMQSPLWIPSSRPSLGPKEEEYLLDALHSTWISSSGQYLDRLEQTLAQFLEVKYAVLVSNGTNALHLALSALGLKSGDEVLVPDLTFAASANTVMHCGAIPVLLDSLPDHWNMDPAQLEKGLSPRTKGVMAVHLLGHACLMDPIRDFCREHGLWLVEDCAEALGSTCGRQKVGGLGQVGCFSFFGNKVITTGEGGLCTTNDENLALTMRQLRGHGMSATRAYWHETTGFNYRMTNLAAAIGLAQAERLPELMARRSHLRQHYIKSLGQQDYYITSLPAPGQISDWLYPLFLKDPQLSRDAILGELRAEGVDARPMFYPLHEMPPYAHIPCAGDMRHSKTWARSGFLLPLFPDLQEEQVEHIAKLLLRLAREGKQA